MVVIWVTITFCLPTPNVSWGCEGVQSSSALFVSFLGVSEWLEQGRCNTEVWLSLPCNNCLCSPVFSSTYTNHLLSYSGQIYQGPFYLSETFGEALPCDTNCTEEPSVFFLMPSLPPSPHLLSCEFTWFVSITHKTLENQGLWSSCYR